MKRYLFLALVLLSSIVYAQVYFEEVVNTGLPGVTQGAIDVRSGQVFISGLDESGTPIAKIYSINGNGTFTFSGNYEGVYRSAVALGSNIIHSGIKANEEAVTLVNNGAIALEDPANESLPNMRDAHIAFFDLDNDGAEDDVFISGFATNLAGAVFGNVSGFYRRVSVNPDPGEPYVLQNNLPFVFPFTDGDAVFADYDGNGYKDLFHAGMTSNGDPSVIVILSNNGGGNVVTNFNLGELDQNFSATIPLDDRLGYCSIAVGQIGGDSRPDFVISGINNSGVRKTNVYIQETNNAGFRTFVKSDALSMTGIAGNVELYDFDGDFSQDLLITGSQASSGPVMRLFLKESGSFVEYDGGCSPPFSGVFGNKLNSLVDIDGDGDKDIIVSGSNQFGQKVTKVYRTVTFAQSTQRAALMDLYNATGGPNWINNQNWGSDLPLDCWYGVTAPNGLVTRLQLSDNNLIGAIPNSINNLNELEFLQLFNNQITSISTSGLNKLDVLGIGNNNISVLDVSNNLMLRELNCSNNNLSNLDLTNNLELSLLACDNNNLNDLDVSNNINLMDLFANENNYTELDVSNNSLLRIFWVRNTNITSLDLSNNPELTSVRVQLNSQLTSLNLANGNNTNLFNPSFGFDDFVATNCPNLYCITVDDVAYSSNWTIIDPQTIFSEDCTAETDFISFSVPGQIGTTSIDEENQIIDINVPDGTDLTTIIPDFQLYFGATVSVNGTLQESGVTPNDFSSPLTYTVTAANGTTIAEWTVSVSSYCSSNGNDVQFFYINNVALGDINNASQAGAQGYQNFISEVANLYRGDNKIITINGTSTLGPDIYPNGYAVWIDYNQDGDFDDPGELVASQSPTTDLLIELPFTVDNVALTGLTRMRVSMKYNGNPTPCETFDFGEVEDYSINIIDGLSPNIDIMSFTLPGQVSETLIDPVNHTLDLSVSDTFDVTNLIASFTLVNSGATAAISGVPQQSGSTANDFSGPVIYTITAADGVTIQDWVVNVAQQNVPITLIPDPNFEQALIDLGIDSLGALNGSVLTSDVSSVTILDVNNKNISDLTGIEDFSSLLELNCEVNQLSTLDTSNNHSLTHLRCGLNNLSNLDLSNNLLLSLLICTNNNLTSLDVSNNTALETLVCGRNNLGSIDISNNTNLINFNCQDANLSAIDVSNNIALEELSVNVNNITSIDVSNNVNLRILGVANNSLTTLDVSANLALENLSCGLNNLSTLDVSGNTSLLSLGFGFTNISSIDLSTNTALSLLDINGTDLTSINLSGNLALSRLFCSQSNSLTSLNLDSNTALTELYAGFNSSLSQLSIKNGNNTNIIQFDLTNVPNLACVSVDDVVYSTTNWTNVDPQITFSENCTAETNFISFNIPEQINDALIDPVNHTIEVEVSSGSDLTNLVPSFELFFGAEARVGGLLQESGVSSNDFTNPVTYSVTAADGITLQDWLVTVTIEQVIIPVSIHLNGTTDYISIPHDASLDITGDFTLEAWIKPEDISGEKTILIKGNNGQCGNYGLFIKDGNLAFVSNGDCNWATSRGPNSPLQVGVWQHVAAVSNGNNVELYINGVLTDTLVRAAAAGVTNFEDLWIGRSVVSTTNFFFNGKIDEVRLWNTTRTQTDLQNTLNTELSGLEPNLLAYYKLDDINPVCDVEDCSSSENHGNRIDINDINSPPNYSSDQPAGMTDVACGVTLEECAVTLIPDANFEQALIDLGIDSDLQINGQVNTNDIVDVTILDLANRNISDLSGIEDFISLGQLVCPFNQITEIDVSNNTQLIVLSVSYNSLSELDISSNTQLGLLYCDNNSLNTLDLSNNTQLEILGCNNNNLSSLDLSDMASLTQVYSQVNSINSLNLSGCTSLQTLYINSNNLSTIDVSDLTDLSYFNCFGNSLTSLDVSSNFSLETLICDNNQITSLDVTNLSMLNLLGCNDNNLSNLDVSGLSNLSVLNCAANSSLTSLDLSGLTGLTELYCFSNALTSLDLSGSPSLEKLWCYFNQLEYLDVKNGNNTVITEFFPFSNPNLECIQVDDAIYSTANWTNIDAQTTFSENCEDIWEVFVPDTNLASVIGSTYLSSIDTSGDGEISFAEAQAYVGPLDLSNQGITDVTGLQAFTNVTSLDLSGNNISDLSILTEGEVVTLSRGMAYQDVARADFTGLLDLNVSNNLLTQLDVSSIGTLQSLDCSSNQLEVLNVKNGNNALFTGFSSLNNPRLYCVLVDNQVYAETNWTNRDPQTDYNDVACYARLLTKAYLQGPYDGNTGLMNDALRANGQIPLTSPYTDAMAIDSSVLTVTGNDAIIDWVWVELRDFSDGVTVVSSTSALLQADGDVVESDGKSPLVFDGAIDQYFVVLSHRNHLGIQTTGTVKLEKGTVDLDLITDSNQITGGTNAIKDLGNGFFALYSGDYNGDGQVQNTDRLAVEALRGINGYDNADLDGNGEVQNTDLNISLIPNIGKGIQFLNRQLYAKRRTN